MTVKELFSKAAEDTCFRVCIRDLHWHYLETPEGDTVFYVNLSEDPDVFLDTLKNVYDFHVFEWWVHMNSGTVHIVVEEDIV